jgi:hypothetical protein
MTAPRISPNHVGLSSGLDVDMFGLWALAAATRSRYLAAGFAGTGCGQLLCTPLTASPKPPAEVEYAVMDDWVSLAAVDSSASAAARRPPPRPRPPPPRRRPRPPPPRRRPPPPPKRRPLPPPRRPPPPPFFRKPDDGFHSLLWGLVSGRQEVGFAGWQQEEAAGRLGGGAGARGGGGGRRAPSQAG